MKSHPVPFGDEMVRAILEDRKTRDRRPIKHRLLKSPCDFRDIGNGPEVYGAGGVWLKLSRPYQAGDILWVRECFCLESNLGIDTPERYPPPFKDGRPILWVDDEERGRYWQQPHYRATDPKPGLCDEDCRRIGWTPSIFMPRWASRIELRVVRIWEESLQDITEADAKAEGVLHITPARLGFRELWDSLYGDKYPWKSNPTVWVTEFERTKP